MYVSMIIKCIGITILNRIVPYYNLLTYIMQYCNTLNHIESHYIKDYHSISRDVSLYRKHRPMVFNGFVLYNIILFNADSTYDIAYINAYVYVLSLYIYIKSIYIYSINAYRDTSPIWRFPEIGPPKSSSILVGISLINHLFWGSPMTMETPICIHLGSFKYQFHGPCS